MSAPFHDTLDGLEAVLEGRISRMLFVMAGLVAGWWLYVPFHEFLHALGCLATGGEVWELEIAQIYGGGFYASLFDWVTPHSEYAGRLSGFDTHGKDWVYLATDLGPYLLTLFPGVWLWRRAVAWKRPMLWGAMLPVALAPFVSLTGDAYEIGSILVTRLPGWSSEAVRSIVRGDDLFLVASKVPAGVGLMIPVVGAAIVGALWAWLWYGLADRIAGRLERMAEVSAEGGTETR
ncbi:MAG: hypothetical protein K8J08_05520 [Thermoanaerobaculia bacterium]|nr:hypothetical protein [Thermoanaerobaculia bacterium]